MFHAFTIIMFLQKQAEKLIEDEFIAEKKAEFDSAKKKAKKNGKTIKVVNENTGKIIFWCHPIKQSKICLIF